MMQQKVRKTKTSRVVLILWFAITVASISGFMWALIRHHPNLLCLLSALVMLWNVWLIRRQSRLKNDQKGEVR